MVIFALFFQHGNILQEKTRMCRINIIAFPLIFICTAMIYGVSFVKFPTNLLWWLLGIPLMWKLIMLYCPFELYGIGDPTGVGIDFTSAETDAAIFALELFLLQCGIKLVLFIKEVIRRRIYPM